MSKPPEDLRARGERHGAAKLTEKDVREIRRRYAAGGETFASLSDAFRVSPQTISGIVHLRSWRHVDEMADDLSGSGHSVAEKP